MKTTWTSERKCIVDGKINVSLTKYDTVEELLCEMYQTSLEDLRNSEHGGFDKDGNEHSFSFNDLIDNIKKSGCYGFTGMNNDIHYWIDNTVVTYNDLIPLFAHEIGHTVEPFYRDTMKEEIKAERYSDVAAMAYQIASKEMCI